MYRQSIKNIKLVIMLLDGVVLDLNRLRYNYYKYTANQKKIAVSREEFSQALSNMYDMYNELPLHNLVDSGPLNAKIERELFQYSKLKGIQVKDGVYEFIEYLKQKDIPIAILSTHRTRDAVEYLKMVNLYDKVQFIIGSDTSSFPLPSTSILKTINEHFHVASEDTLVISSFECLNRVASSLNMNLIYLDDFVKANTFVQETSYRVVSSMFEALNVMLFDKYEETDMYSTILGMDDDMSESQLNKAYDSAKSAYSDDQQIMDLVDKTYQYHLSQLQPQLSKNAEITKHFSFDDDDEINQIATEIQDEQPFFQETELDLEKAEDTAPLQSIPLSEKEELTSLLNKINKRKDDVVLSMNLTDELEEQSDEQEFVEDKEKSVFLSVVTTLFYIMITSFLILIVGIVFTVAFINPLQSGQGVFGMITTVFSYYNDFVTAFFEMILNGLHIFIPFIPNYSGYKEALTMFSSEGIQLLHFFIFHCLVLGLVHGVKKLFIKEDFEDD